LVLAGGLLAGAVVVVGVPPDVTMAQGPEVVKISIYPAGMMVIKGPDERFHDAFVPSSFIVHAGVPVQLTFINYDDSPHTLTAPDLDLNITIDPGTDVPWGSGHSPVTTTYTFTPEKKGQFRWFNSTPCDTDAGGWAMDNGFEGPGREGYMAGFLEVI
jgi:plastocyanin